MSNGKFAGAMVPAPSDCMKDHPLNRDNEYQECGNCDGTGWVIERTNIERTKIERPEGKDKISCPSCDGTGKEKVNSEPDPDEEYERRREGRVFENGTS